MPLSIQSERVSIEFTASSDDPQILQQLVMIRSKLRTEIEGRAQKLGLTDAEKKGCNCSGS